MDAKILHNGCPNETFLGSNLVLTRTLHSDSRSVKTALLLTVVTILLAFFMTSFVSHGMLVRCFYVFRGFEFCDLRVHDPHHYQTFDKLTKPTPPVAERVGIDDKQNAAISCLATAPESYSDVGIRDEAAKAGEQPTALITSRPATAARSTI